MSNFEPKSPDDTNYPAYMNAMKASLISLGGISTKAKEVASTDENYDNWTRRHISKYPSHRPLLTEGPVLEPLSNISHILAPRRLNLAEMAADDSL